jgi:predicted dehydrogenase
MQNERETTMIDNKLVKKINRREFFKAAGGTIVAGLSLPTIITRPVFGKASPGNQITLGFIGTGMQGRMLLTQFLSMPDCRVVALCDVDKQKLNAAMSIIQENSLGKCDSYNDFWELLARADIDGVVIAVPEHWHSIIAIEACRAGKDVYCEKPLSLTIAESRNMVKEARRAERVFQTGSMQRSDFKFRQACEIVRNGLIGDIKTVRVAIAGGGYPMYPIPCNLPAEPVPDYLDWNRWLGPNQWRPYNSRLAPPMDEWGWPHWRDYQGFAGGLMSDWGAHHFDIAQWGLGTDDSGPVEINPADNSYSGNLMYRYANGTKVVKDDTIKYKSIKFYGTKGQVEVSREFIETKPESLLFHRFGPNDIRLYKSDNHYTNWLDCVRTRQKPICDVEIGCRSATVCHLGIIAHQLNRTLKWDPVKEQFIGDEQANRLINRTFRSPWRL